MDGSIQNPTADQTREEIVRQATMLFSHYGYSKTNIGDIAQACGMSAGNLYRYFRNKIAIGYAVVDAFMEEELAHMRNAVARTSGCSEEKLRVAVTTPIMFTVQSLRECPKIIELAELICADSAGLKIVKDHTIERQAIFEEIVKTGLQNGEFNAPCASDAARAIMMGTKFFHVPHNIVRHGLDIVEQDLSVTLDLLCAGLRAR